MVLSSASKNLPDDLVKSAVLVDPRGRKYQALVWEGAPSSGRHRAGVLKFIAIKPRPSGSNCSSSGPAKPGRAGSTGCSTAG